MNENKYKTTPAYMPYPTLKNTVETFADTTTPTKLNRHVLSSLSGAAHNALISGLCFMGLANQDESVTEGFGTLVRARRKSEQEYKTVLIEILHGVYDSIIGGVNIENGTLPELEKAFKASGVTQGQMLTKSVRFYVKALQDCGFPVSPHITKPRARRALTRKKQAAEKNDTPPGDPPKDSENGNGGSDTDKIPKGFGRLPIIGREGAFIQYPMPLTEQDCAVIEAAVGYLRALVKANPKEDK